MLMDNVPVLLTEHWSGMELTLAVASTYFRSDQKQGNCPFVLKCSYQGEINARINDWVGKKLNSGFPTP